MTRRGFTLIELLVAGMMASIVLGGITISLSQLGSAKAISRQRLEAYSRCDTALRTIRKEIITVLRRDDLFDTRLLITENSGRFLGKSNSQDELLLFNGNLRANKEIDFNGEGMEYETQFRIENNDVSSALWKRRDAILDDNPTGGGMATPIADGIVAIELEAFDGTSWVGLWDSDELGLPHAIRITISATGMQSENERHAPLVTLRSIVPLDRVQTPLDKLQYIAAIEAQEQGLDDLPGGLGTGTGTGEGAGGDDAGGAGGAGGTGGTGGTGKGPDIPGRNPSKPSGGGTGTGTTQTKGGTTIIDPDGNEHEIPPPP